MGGRKMRKHLKHLKTEKGFTLIELLAVIVILGIIAAIAVPMIGNVINESKDKAILADASSILSAARLAQANGEGNVDSPTTGKTTFNKTILDQYVDGVTLDADDEVVFTAASGTSPASWEIKFKAFEKLKISENKTYTPSGDITMTNDELNSLLNPGS